MTHDSGRIRIEKAANNFLNFSSSSSSSVVSGSGSKSPLLSGRAYLWRVRTWTVAAAGGHSDGSADCSSTWSSATFTTALHDGFAAKPIWLPSLPSRARGRRAAPQQLEAALLLAPSNPIPTGQVCNLTGVWRGNGGPSGIPITIKPTVPTVAATVDTAASITPGSEKYIAKDPTWTNFIYAYPNSTVPSMLLSLCRLCAISVPSVCHLFFLKKGFGEENRGRWTLNVPLNDQC